MFGWGKKKTPKPEDTRAYQLGSDMGGQMAHAINGVLEARFGQLEANYIAVLRDRIHLTFNDERAPPLTLARIEYKIFIENLDEMTAMLATEIPTLVGDWMDAAETMGVRLEVDQLITQRIDEFATDLRLLGLKILADDYGKALAAADDTWRAKNPSLAAQFPKD